jgi:hypothetical protein
MGGMFSEEPKKIEQADVSKDIDREREALVRRSKVDQNTTVAGAGDGTKASTFRSVLGR